MAKRKTLSNMTMNELRREKLIFERKGRETFFKQSILNKLSRIDTQIKKKSKARKK